MFRTLCSAAALAAAIALPLAGAAQYAEACTRIFANDQGRRHARRAQHGLGDDHTSRFMTVFPSRHRARRRQCRVR